MGLVFNKTKELYMNEGDVTTVIKAMTTQYMKIKIKNVGGIANRWYVIFNSSDKDYRRLLKALKTVGSIEFTIGPYGSPELYFKKS